MQTAINQVTPSTLGEVLMPLIAVLTADPSGKKPFLMEETEYITGLPDVDPTSTAVFQILEDFTPQRLCKLVGMTGRGKDDLPGQVEGQPILNPISVPIHFTLVKETVCYCGRMGEERYLLATMEAGLEHDLADAERQVALLIEQFTK